MSIADAIAGIALKVSAAVGAGYWDAQIITQADVELDEGGSIADSSDPVLRPCSAQVDVATTGMRLEDGFVEEDRRILVLAGTLDGGITAEDAIELLAGPFAGTWSIQSVKRDPAAVAFELRARPV